MLIVLMPMLLATACNSQHRMPNDCKPPSHQLWTDLLSVHVDSTGFVSYIGFVSDSVRLSQYCALLSHCPPNNTWSKNEKLAYWINVYNAFTIKLIVDHYPVSSIKEIKKGIPFINSVWDMEFFEIGGVPMDLNDVEHDILREEFNEPRIHFAIVCASASCPQLRNEAFVAGRLEEQLQQQALDFVNNPARNQLDVRKPRISSIFKWFSGDFTKNGTLVQFLNKYSRVRVDENATVKYLKYDWNLNGK